MIFIFNIFKNILLNNSPISCTKHKLKKLVKGFVFVPTDKVAYNIITVGRKLYIWGSAKGNHKLTYIPTTSFLKNFICNKHKSLATSVQEKPHTMKVSTEAWLPKLFKCFIFLPYIPLFLIILLRKTSNTYTNKMHIYKMRIYVFKLF